ncbi:hypothetical protein Trydic_g19589 [Trypoxylus dichotomus]
MRFRYSGKPITWLATYVIRGRQKQGGPTSSFGISVIDTKCDLCQRTPGYPGRQPLIPYLSESEKNLLELVTLNTKNIHPIH